VYCYKNRDVAKRSLIGRQRRPTYMLINVTQLLRCVEIGTFMVRQSRFIS